MQLFQAQMAMNQILHEERNGHINRRRERDRQRQPERPSFAVSNCGIIGVGRTERGRRLRGSGPMLHRDEAITGASESVYFYGEPATERAREGVTVAQGVPRDKGRRQAGRHCTGLERKQSSAH